MSERDTGARQFHQERDLVPVTLPSVISTVGLCAVPGAGERSAILFKSVGDLNRTLRSLEIGLPVSRDVGGGGNHGENCEQESRFYQLGYADYN